MLTWPLAAESLAAVPAKGRVTDKAPEVVDALAAVPAMGRFTDSEPATVELLAAVADRSTTEGCAHRNVPHCPLPHCAIA